MVRAAILVDNMYLEHVGDIFGVGRVDIDLLPKLLLKADEQHHRTYVFDALPWVPPDPTQEQITRKDEKHRYLQALEYKERVTVERGYVQPKPTHCRKCGAEFDVPIQKLVDVKISTRLVALAFSRIVDLIVLVAGDADLLPAVEAIRDTPCNIRLAYAEREGVKTAKPLIRVCHEKRLLTQQDLEACRYKGSIPEISS
jgi:uncharacterized LabA/DUF88 family protein